MTTKESQPLRFDVRELEQGVAVDSGCRITMAGQGEPSALVGMDPYAAAVAFVKGDLQVLGDIYSAIRFFTAEGRWNVRGWLRGATAWLIRSIVYAIRGDRRATAHDIQFHYDLSNEFYGLFLDSRMQYSAAYFVTPDCSLEEAQAAKLHRICSRLHLHAGDRLLDIGCGWGGLLSFAGEYFGAGGLGCTLSRRQLEFATARFRDLGLDDRISVCQTDYRDLTGAFDRVSSIGMFEHVGHSRLRGYFRKVYSLLVPGGLFLNRGVVRPQTVHDGPETLFLQTRVFPGGELIHPSDVVREAEEAGFALVSAESETLDYARTCREWVRGLQKDKAACEREVGSCQFRTWLLYLAGSALSFEAGRTGAMEFVFRKPR